MPPPVVRRPEARPGLPPRLRPAWTSGGAGRVQLHRGADQRLQRRLVDRLTLANVDGAADVAVEAGVEQALRILQRGAPGEGQLDDVLIGLAGGDDAVVRPH